MLTHVQQHPLLNGLHTAVIDAEAAYKEASDACNDLCLYPTISTTRWARRIEAAGDRISLAQVKSDHFEAVLTFESRATNFHLRSLTLERKLALLRERLRTSAKPVKELNHKSEHNWIRPMLVRTYIKGAALLESEIPGISDLAPEYSDRNCRHRHLGMVKKAFQTLVTTLGRAPKCETGPSFIGHSFGNLYPTDYIVPEGDKEVRERRRLRSINFLTLDDVERPNLLGLSDAIREAEAAETKAGLALRNVKGNENGSINEYQYASRLTAMLADGDLDGDLDETVGWQHKQQHDKRVAFEGSRQLLFATIVEAELARQRLALILREAIVETEALLGLATRESSDQLSSGVILRNKTRSDSTISMQRAAMLNCLHADVVIRHLGRLLSATHGKAQFDYSYGNGQLATEAQLDACIARVTDEKDDEEEE